MTEFLDYFARQGEPFYACISARGYGVVRYLSDRDAAKSTNATEYGLAKKYRVPFALVWETFGDYAAYFTADQGTYDAQAAIRLARSIGYQAGKAIFFAVDADVSAAQAVEYFNAIYNVFQGEGFPWYIGVYGGHKVTGANWPAVAWRWQTPAWSNGVIDAADNLYQYDQQTICGVKCDINRVTGDFSKWASVEDDMNPAQVQAMIDASINAYADRLQAQLDAVYVTKSALSVKADKTHYHMVSATSSQSQP